MKKFRVTFTIKDTDGEKRRGETIINAKSNTEAMNKIREALAEMNIKDVTIVSSNEVVE